MNQSFATFLTLPISTEGKENLIQIPIFQTN